VDANVSTVKELKAKTIAGKTADERAVLQADTAYAATDADATDAESRTMEGRAELSPGVLRFMRVWVKDGAAWKIAAEQRTPIAAAPRPKT
jgi:hypothetical protein